MSWVTGAAGSLFDLDNLPYGVFSYAGQEPRVGVRIGDFVMDASAVAAYGGDPGDGPHLAEVWSRPSLNPFLALGREAWDIARDWLIEVLGNDVHEPRTAAHLIPLDRVTLHLPFEVADYVDFYASVQHATNVGRIFRPDGEALTPNWRHLPIGYHGRAGTVVVSGTPVRRPVGQGRPGAGEARPAFGPSRRLDIEAELGFVVGVPSTQGDRVPASAFADHVFGVTPLNDWSARDIQAWEYVPLGPFLGKSFATSISPWVTPLAALEAARVDLPAQDPEPLEYLRVGERAGFDIAYEVLLNGEVVSRPPYAAMYWSPAQMLAHLTVNGASLRTGDLYASGTISGDERDQRGSFLELSWGGSEPFALSDGRARTFLEDGDEIVLRATAPGVLGGRIGLGEVTGKISPS
ncbi:fumarylacetoacetase [Nocardioides marmoriginsengisoli]|uniref:fumarylacetoacetase n=1 Tax=Nocardioides marmoriginsengisoli TaxID=661483 RepID=A0A3N0CI28_9ACTN|nr:fumarylacetoacetase [Nocardioides marmoriginsengisoli]RNL63128.1 fumarylacetoacetase [Nocardioides marmoriginsengisoli]